jgi:hypothetical protein
MLNKRQAAILGRIGATFWLADAAWIRLLPTFIVDPVWGDVGFLLSIPVAWICTRLAQRVTALDRSELVAGITLMVMVAALLHAVGIRWAPELYGEDHADRLGGAWLLWIYGLILGCALLMARYKAHAQATSSR